MERLGEALAKLDPESRALLDLSTRRGLEDGEIAGILSVRADDVADRREQIISELETELGLTTRDQRAELRADLPDLPARLWNGR